MWFADGLHGALLQRLRIREDGIVRAHVNGEECSVSMEGVDTIGDLLKRLEVHAPPRDVIVGLRINGGEYEGGATSQIRNLSVIGVEEIELQTQSPEAFAGGARSRLHEYLEMIHTRFERAVECFHRGAEAEGLEYYQLGVEEMHLLVTLWDQLNRLDAGASGPDEAFKADLQGICDRLLTAQDRNDLVTVRAVLADRLLPLLRRWRAAALS